MDENDGRSGFPVEILGAERKHAFPCREGSRLAGTVSGTADFVAVCAGRAVRGMGAMPFMLANFTKSSQTVPQDRTTRNAPMENMALRLRYTLSFR